MRVHEHGTTSTSGDTAERSPDRSAGATRRGLFGASTKPSASTPSSQARRTSPARVMPQNFTRVRVTG
jgi:hypothetical protein